MTAPSWVERLLDRHGVLAFFATLALGVIVWLALLWVVFR